MKAFRLLISTIAIGVVLGLCRSRIEAALWKIVAAIRSLVELFI